MKTPDTPLTASRHSRFRPATTAVLRCAPAADDPDRAAIKPHAAYPLRRDDAEHRRLAAQAAFWAADAAALFDAAGVAAGARIADLGCGTSHVAAELARRVGAAGRVHALDSDARLLATIDREAVAPWIEPVLGDAYATPWPDGALDAAHARFVAAPCGRVGELLTEMRRIVRPGGLVMLQEPVADSWQLPAGAAWPRLLDLIRTGFALRGGDFDAGRDLHPRVASVLSDVHERRVVHRLPADHPYAALPLAFCEALRDSWRSAGLVDDGERESLMREVGRALHRPGASIVTFTLVQVWGRVV